MNPPQLLFTSPPPMLLREQEEESKKREDFSEKINLDLGIGTIGSVEKKNKNTPTTATIKQEEKEESFFTSFQFHEFYNQILVYNFLASGLPIPFHLFIPIWTSVFSFYGSDIFNKYPSFTGFSPRLSSYGGLMDPEPGRCLRTDGRKWRCSKNVIPDQKYCESHMHRGRQRSRKLVESSEKVSEPHKITSTVHNDNNSKNDLSNHTKEKDAGNGSTNLGKIGSRKRRGYKSNSKGSVSQGFGLSPKSVLQCGKGKLILALASNETTVEAEPKKCRRTDGKKSQCSKDAIPGQYLESEQQRCRRTDGKKWHCNKDAVPNQKYCESHMHRGAKKRALDTESAFVSLSVPQSPDNGINLNTMPHSPTENISGNHSTSSISDATTITDETISVCCAQVLHK